jgi:hypothetical protein
MGCRERSRSVRRESTTANPEEDESQRLIRSGLLQSRLTTQEILRIEAVMEQVHPCSPTIVYITTADSLALRASRLTYECITV